MATFALIDLQEAASVGLNGEGGDSAVADFSQLLWLSVTAALADSSSSSSLTVLLRLPPAVFSVSRLESWKYIHAILAAIYVTATAYIMRALDTTSSSVAHLRLPLDVVILDWCSYDPTSLSSGLQNHFSMDALGNIIHRSRDGDDEMKANTGDLTLLPHQRLVLSPYFSQTSIVASSAASPAVGGAYSDVALGGTFDHLHIGHKILLTAALWITQYRLVCGTVIYGNIHFLSLTPYGHKVSQTWKA